ncbi:DUF3329 domain-containing protein [Lacticaseibacillus sp. N501-2]|uniref:DUF3329 domain-containing protein n=1 Tax=Lacticaseibacillus salsurae TaxID=3367729 RepID=UPI0038B3A5B1
MNRKVNKGVWAVGIITVTIGVFLFIKLLYDLSGYSGDDYLYHFFYQGELPHGQLRGINNLWDLIRSVQNHTRIYNGRFVAHTGVMLAMQLPKAVFNAASAAVFVLLGWLIDLHVFGRQRVRVAYLGLTYVLMWFALPDYGTTVLWLSGAFNYLWVALIYLTFLLPYRFNYHAKHPRLMTAAMAILGVLAGATNENTAPLTLFIAFALTLFDWHQSQLAWKWTGGIAACFGFYVVVVSGVNQISVRGKQFELNQLLTKTMTYSGLWLGLVAVILLYMWWQHHNFGHQLLWSRDRDYLAACLYTLGAVLGIVALIVSPQILSRVFFGPNLYLLIALLMLLHDHDQLRAGTYIAKLLPGLIALILAIAAFPGYQAAVRSNALTYRIWATGDAIVRHDAKIGVQHAAVPGMIPVYTDRNQYWQSTYVGHGDPKKQWFNEWMAAYYGVKTVTVDNTIKLKSMTAYQKTPEWGFYQFFSRLFADVHLTAQKVHAATAMRTAYLVYVDTTGKQVGIEPISGNVGTTFDISHASVAGYTTQPGNPKAYTFIAAARQSVVIQVTKQAANAKALLVYQTRDGHQVATEPISGVVGQTIDLTHASTPGYTTQADSPKSYRLTGAPSQKVIVPVAAQRLGTTVEYISGHQVVLKVYQTTKTGQPIKLKAPLGYRLSAPKQVSVMPASGIATLKVPIERVHGVLALKASIPLKLVIAGLIVVIWDQLAALRKYRDFKLFTKLKRKEHEA